MLNLHVHFNGIVVTPENQIYIQECFSAIYSLSPSESSVTFTFEKEGEDYVGNVKINAQVKNFSVSCKGDTLNAVMKSLNSEVRQNLKDWKKERFDVA